jgi:hypothetical protein
MRGASIAVLMHLARPREGRLGRLRSGAPDGTYACFVRHVRYWSGQRAGEEETLEGGEWELNVITDQNLLWERQEGESVHDGLPLSIVWRPGGVEQLVAHNRDMSLIIRIALGLNPEKVPMPFTALGTNITLSGICFFQPRLPS